MVLLRFLDEVFPELNDTERAAFEALLEQQDPDLAAWILGGESAPEQWRGVVGKIQAVIREW